MSRGVVRSTASPSRRGVLAGLAAGGAALLAGCGGDGSTPTPSPTDADQFTDRPIEVLHGWTGGDGGPAIRSVERMFRARHPRVGLDLRPVGGTGNENLNSAIKRRLANGNPPSAFASWPGPTLAQYEGQLLDVSEVWEAGGFADAMHARASEFCRREGAYRAVPIGAHRLNTLYYRIEHLEAAGIDPSELSSVPDLTGALERIEAETDVVPLAHAMQAPWTNLQLLGEVLLSQSGPSAYRDFVSGNGDRSTLVDALEATADLLDRFINQDASVISFTEANRKFIRGEAAAIYQGSWVYSMYRNADGHAYGTDWDWVPFPGTDGTYVGNLDAFTFPTGNPTPEKTDVWAAFVGRPDPQIAFSNRKGSVPVRTDFDSERLATFPRRIWTALQDSAEFLPTLAHGLAVRPGKLRACKSVVRQRFMDPFDVERTADGLLDALGS